MKLVTVTSNTISDKLKNNEDIMLLYPLKSYTVGYPITFDIKDIDGFVLFNRILDDFEIDELEKQLHEKNNIKGIVFDDLGILDIVSDLNITKILLINHYANNTRSINYYLEYTDSVVVSSDITEEEIKEIVKNTIKPVVVNVFGMKDLMYSRRLLLTNYAKHYNISNKDMIDAKINDNGFKIFENEYGTYFYASKYYNALDLLDLDNVLYFWYNPVFLDDEEILDVVINNDVNNIDNDSLFLDKATTYRIGEAHD